MEDGKLVDEFIYIQKQIDPTLKNKTTFLINVKNATGTTTSKNQRYKMETKNLEVNILV